MLASRSGAVTRVGGGGGWTADSAVSRSAAEHGGEAEVVGHGAPFAQAFNQLHVVLAPLVPLRVQQRVVTSLHCITIYMLFIHYTVQHQRLPTS